MMNTSKKTKKRKHGNRTKKSIILLAATIIILAVAYLLHDIVISWLFPCRGIFEQTAPSIKANMKVVKVKGEVFLGKEQIQELTEQSQQVALNLKTCCILLHEGLINSEEFLKCKESARDFESNVEEIVNLLDEAQRAKEQRKSKVVDEKTEEINRVLKSLEISPKASHERIKRLARRQPESRRKVSKAPSQKVISEVEPNNTYTQAMEIPMAVMTGELADDDNIDYYKFEVPNGHILKLDFTPHHERNYMNIFLLNSERRGVWGAQNVPPEATRSTRVMMNTTSGGTYYINVERKGGSGPYEFEVSTQSQNDAGSGNDAGDEILKALEIEPGQLFPGELGGFDREDWYKFNIPNGHILNLTFTPNEKGKSMDVSLKNFERKTVWYYDNVAPGVRKSTRVMMNTSSGGVYYVIVYDGKGQYEFELSTESQNDAGSGNDAGDKITQALEIKPGQSFSGELGGFDEEDWYKFTPVEGKVVSFTPGSEGRAMDISLRNFERKSVWYYDNVTPGVTKSFKIPKVLMPPYFIRIYDGSGKYTFEVK